MLRDPKQYCWWKQLLLAAELVKCARYTAIMRGVLMTRNLSDYFLKNSSIDLNIPITSDYHCTKRGTLFLTVPCVGVSHYSVSHSDTSKPVLQPSTPKQKSDRFFNLLASQDLSIKHTKLVKAPAYTRVLPDIGTKECFEMVIEHEAQCRYRCFN